MNKNVWEKGDKIICVNNTISRNGKICGEPELELYAFYTVSLMNITDDNYPNRVILEECATYEFSETKFMTIKQYRKLKILKIENPAD